MKDLAEIERTISAIEGMRPGDRREQFLQQIAIALWELVASQLLQPQKNIDRMAISRRGSYE